MKNSQDEHKHMNEINADWNGINKKVNLSQESLERNSILTPEEKRSILKARAKALAVEQDDTSGKKEFIEIIVFGLASETYGIESRFTREVYSLKDFTPLPGIPSFVLGIINVRGKIVSVIDFKKFFNLPEKGIGELNKVIIINNERMEFGILADSVHGTRTVSLDEIKPSPVTSGGIGAGYLKGVTNDHVIILDSEAILDDDKIIIHQKSY